MRSYLMGSCRNSFLLYNVGIRPLAIFHQINGVVQMECWQAKYQSTLAILRTILSCSFSKQ